MEYRPPFGSLDPDAPYVDEDLASGLLGSIVPAKSIEDVQRELVEVIRYFLGETPTGEDLTQVRRAIQVALGDGGNAGEGFNRRLIFAPGTTVWTPPVGVTLCFAQLWGGGGGGGGAQSNGGAGAGGGGGGYYAGFLDVEPGVGIAITVGQGGVGGGPAAAGQSGGTTLFGARAGAYGGTGGGGSAGGVGRPVGRAGKGFGETDDAGNPKNFLQGGGFGGTGSLTGSNLYRGGSGGMSFGSGQSPEPVGAVGTGQPPPFDLEYIVPNVGQGGAGASNNGFGLSGQYGLVIVDYRHPD